MPIRSDHTVTGWEVDNVEEVIQALREKGDDLSVVNFG